MKVVHIRDGGLEAMSPLEIRVRPERREGHCAGSRAGTSRGLRCSKRWPQPKAATRDRAGPGRRNCRRHGPPVFRARAIGSCARMPTRVDDRRRALRAARPSRERNSVASGPFCTPREDSGGRRPCGHHEGEGGVVASAMPRVDAESPSSRPRAPLPLLAWQGMLSAPMRRACEHAGGPAGTLTRTRSRPQGCRTR